MTDLNIMRNGELMVAQVQGETDEGVEFVDCYMPETEYHVVDSGRILVPEGALADLRAAAQTNGLTYAEETV